MYLIVYLKILFCFLYGPQDDLHYGISPIDYNEWHETTESCSKTLTLCPVDI